MCCKGKVSEGEKVYPKYILMSVFAFLCLGAMYVAVICFTWSRHHDLKWRATLDKKHSYFTDVSTLFRSTELNEYFEWMQVVNEIKATWDDDNSHVTTSSLKDGSKQSTRIIAGSEYSEKLDQSQRFDRKLSIERAFKAQEVLFQFVSIILLIFAHGIFILPFFFQLQVRFRSRLLKLSLIYAAMGCVCFFVGIMEIQSVFETNSHYSAYEDLALNGSKAAILVASCKLSKSEFNEMVIRNKRLKAMRNSFHVCQDAGLKLTASFIFIGVWIVYFIFFAVLFRDYCYAMKNRIIPLKELLALEVATQNASMIEKDDEEEAESQHKQLKKLKEEQAEQKNKQKTSPGAPLIRNSTLRNSKDNLTHRKVPNTKN